MRVLVTGAAGFIGSHLCERLLDRGLAVIGLDDFNAFYSPEAKRRNVADLRRRAGALGGSLEIIDGDVRDAHKLGDLFARSRPDVLVHLAAMAGVRSSIAEPALYTSVNVGGTTALLDAAQRHGTRRIVFASSSSVYGNAARVPFCEDDPADRPISPYAATKRACELVCHAFHHIWGARVACLRLFTVYGPRQRPDLAIRTFAERILDGREIVLFGDGSTSRDYTWVGDIVFGIEAAIGWTDSAEPRFDIFNLGNAQPEPLGHLVGLIEDACGAKARLRWEPQQPGDVERTFADISRAGRILGYRPRMPLADGIARFVEWLRAERHDAS